MLGMTIGQVKIYLGKYKYYRLFAETPSTRSFELISEDFKENNFVTVDYYNSSFIINNLKRVYRRQDFCLAFHESNKLIGKMKDIKYYEAGDIIQGAAVDSVKKEFKSQRKVY